jgi:hypothetical protein
MVRIKRILVEKNMTAVRAAVGLVIVLAATAVESRINSPLSVIIALSTIN